jgi:sulfate permease, SulP family
MGTTAETGRRGSSWRSTLPGDVTAAVVSGLPTAIFTISYAALICSGPASSAEPTCLVALLTACLVTGIATALLSSLPFAAAAPDGNTTVIFAAMAAAVVQGMAPTAMPGTLNATILMMLMLSALAVGVLMMALGVARAGRIVRFVPHQVMAGFLGATGYALTVGGIQVGIGHGITWARLVDPADWPKLATVLAVGIALLLLIPRLRNPFALPGLIVAAAVSHHVVFAGLGLSLEHQGAQGWLMTVPARLPIGIPWTPTTLQLVDWLALERAAPGLLAILVVAAISVMLNVSSLELATARDADIDRELRASGAAALASGLLGGGVGYTAVSRSLVLLRSGAQTRLAGCIAGMVAGLLPILAPRAMGLLPRPILGGLLVYVGLQLLDQWIVRTRRTLSLGEWLTALLVVAVTTRFGVIIGIFTGLAVGCVSFAMSYSRATPIRARYRGTVAVSNVDRAPNERALLQTNGESQLVLHLQGYLLFGTANRLLEHIRREIAATPGGLQFLVLDFHNVDGLDSSAVSSFTRLNQVAAAEQITLVLTSMAPDLAARLSTVPVSPKAPRLVFASLDAGLEYCEEMRLAGLQNATTDQSLLKQFEIDFGDAAIAERFFACLEPIAVVAGTVLMAQGDDSDELLFIESGKVSVFVSVGGGHEFRASRSGAGTMMGEIGFVLGKPRTATVRADTDCQFRQLTRATLLRLEQEERAIGIAVHAFLTRRVSERLLDKDRLIAALVRGNRAIAH